MGRKLVEKWVDVPDEKEGRTGLHITADPENDGKPKKASQYEPPSKQKGSGWLTRDPNQRDLDGEFPGYNSL